MHTRLRIIGNDGRPRYQWMHHGVDGNVQTLVEMRALVLNDIITDVGLEDFANKILETAKVEGDVYGRSSTREINTIFKYVRNKIIFRNDPGGGNETIQDARVTIEKGFGDCDDFAVTLATLLGLVGHMTRFVVVRVDPNAAAIEGFAHVYVDVFDTKQNKWLALDASNKKAVPGWEPRSIERKTFLIYGDHPSNELAGFKSFFKKVGKGLKKVGKIAAPVAAGFIPGVGAYASQGVSAAFDAVDAKKAQKQQQQEAQTAYDAQQSQAQAAAAIQTQAQPGDIAGLSPTVLIVGGAGLIALLALLKS